MKMLSLFSGVGMQALTEIKQLRRKNSQLGGKVARYWREKEELEDALAMYQ